MTEAQFWASVDKNGPTPAHVSGLGACWLWTRWRNGQGYGRVCWLGATWGAHRLSYVLSYREEIPDGMLVMHYCDNPSCVRPKHLTIGTSSDNAMDAFRKRRRRAGPGRGHKGPMKRMEEP